MYTLFNKLQLWKALSPMEVTLVGITILVNEEQPEKAPAAILVTLVGIVILVNPVQLWKALAAILVTLVGIVILVNPVQLWKALSAILVTLVGIVILVNPVQLWKALSAILVTLVGIVILVNPEQPEKALAAILVTLVGIVILVNVEQPEKALAAILVTLLLLIITCFNVVRLLNPDKLVRTPSVVYVNPPSVLVQVNPDHTPFSTEELKTNMNVRIYLFAKRFGVVKAGLLEFTLVTYKFAVEEISVNASVPIVSDAVEKMYTLFNKLQLWKALFPMEVTLVGITILVNSVQP
jgi:hypothetical protein